MKDTNGVQHEGSNTYETDTSIYRDNLTALVSAFARAYHYKNNHRHISADPLADKMLTDEEYTTISQNMSQGISYFAPDFRGTQEEALRFIVDHQLAPSVLARSAFCERAVSNAVMLGYRQIIILHAVMTHFPFVQRKITCRYLNWTVRK